MATDELPAQVRKLLIASGFDVEAPPTRRIFTNRDLAFDSIGVVGFDMDYTLGMYRQDELEALSTDVTIDKLIQAGYPEQLRAIESDPDFAVRGLVVDKRMGNVLKMDRHGYVGRAYHGKRRLVRAERKGIYRAQRIGDERPRFAYVDTLFALPEVTIYGELVELIDASPEIFGDGRPPSYEEAWADVRNAIDQAHQDESIKQAIKADPARFFQSDPELAPTLHKLRSGGKKLFLLTNSYYPYTEAVMSFLLDDKLDAYEDWSVFFDWMIVGSGKPGFFTESEPFQELEFRTGRSLGRPKTQVQRGKIYQGGNQIALQEALGVHPDEVLYVGDHIYGDIVKSKKSSGWRTALVVEDLEHELAVRQSHSLSLREVAALSELRHELTEVISDQRHLMRTLANFEASELTARGLDEPDAAALLETAQARALARFDRLRAHRTELEETLDRRRLEVEQAFNPYWGSIFVERNDTSLFGSQVENYACIYTSRVSNFLYVSPARYFHAPLATMPHWK
jgi:HAD superfamily 5'-nucleotidase-like hydrolase